MYTGIEPEFMLLSRRADGTLSPADPTDDLDKPCYDYKGLARTREILDEMVAGLRAVGIDVYQIDHEDGNGQFEINFTYADALKTADNFTFVKMAASEIAHKHCMIATFMPKPFSNRTGAAPISMSRWDRRRRRMRSTIRTTNRAWASRPWPTISWRACSNTHAHFAPSPLRR